MTPEASIMAHCVAYFPDAERSMAAALGLADGGADYIEVQFPFSDPTADGPAIQTACRDALESGFTVDRGFSLLTELSANTSVPLCIMSYANLLYRRGIDRFCREAAAAGARGLIVPDLLPPYDEGLYRICREQGLDALPVISPNISDKRLAAIAKTGPRFIYTTLRSGITGSRTEVGEEQRGHLQRCRATGAHIMAGFGIESPEQVAALAPHCDTLVAGSFFVKRLMEIGPGGSTHAYRKRMRQGIEYLYGAK